MTERDRYLETILFGNPDKIPFVPGFPRLSTKKRWQAEGMPQDVDWQAYVWDRIGVPLPSAKPLPPFSVNFRMDPIFEEKILRHENGHFVVQDWMGATTEISDEYDCTYIRNAIDFVTRRWLKFPVETREDWEEMKKRFDPDLASRVPAITPQERAALAARERVLSLSFNGPFWQLREWMGFENLCMAFIDQPAFVAEMIGFWEAFVFRVMQRVFDAHVVPDSVFISEDMAYKAHPMISPAMTREFLLPTYKRWITFLKQQGVKVIDMDSDGYVADLIPIWIEAGFSVNDPVEVAAHNDIVLYRQLYGNRMAFRGGIDKRAIAAGGEQIKSELHRVLPHMLKLGGYIPECDHGVPHDISLDAFIDYGRRLARYTGWL